jgi:hypothetical protein
MLEVNSKKFLDNLIEKESESYKNLFENPCISFSENRRSVLYKVLRINCCKELVCPNFNDLEGVSLLYLEEGLGHLIDKLRKNNVSDGIIYNEIISSRDSFWKSKDLEDVTYDLLLRKKQCLETYACVQKVLLSLLGSTKNL